MDMNVSHSDAIGIQYDRMIKHGSADIKTRFFFPVPPKLLYFHLSSALFYIKRK